MSRPRAGAWSVSTLAIVAGVATWLFAPGLGPDLRAQPHPATSYAQAAALIDSIQATESRAPLIPEAGSLAWLHGAPTDTVVVLFQGYTVVPEPFEVIARGYFERGCNVWAPMMPYHGLRDRMTTDLSRLKPQVFRAYADRAVDVAAGLGRHVLVFGISGGGAIATWSAVARNEVNAAVVISPILLPRGTPAWAGCAIARAFQVLPDHYAWWDPDTRDRRSGLAYPRFSYRGVASLMMMGQWADAEAVRRDRHVPERVVLVWNQSDAFVDGEYTMAHFTRIFGLRPLHIITVPASARLEHDLITPDGANHARIGLSYAYLSRAVGFRLPDPRGWRPHPLR